MSDYYEIMEEQERKEQKREVYERNKTKLFACAMKGEWDNVIQLYKDVVSLHNARITRSGQTALHIAVSDGKEHVVKQMLHVMSLLQKDKLELVVRALRTHNHRGNTALHLAASMGNATICRIIASVEATLVDDRNNDGETPLFLAALHGRKQAFLSLHRIRNPNIMDPPSYDNCRRNKGDTILHCAINGDYFDLAFQIIHLYKDLANWVNEEGLSPLHLLASKPRAFKSGSRLGRIETIIYHCLHVEKLKAENPAHEHQTRPISAADSDSHDCPDNYNTLWNVFSLIKKVVTVVADIFTKSGAESSDAEDPEGSRVDVGRANPLFPDNYATLCNLIRFFSLVLVTILGKGSEQLRNIQRKKETHTWSVQIVKELLLSASSYEYEDDGRNPQEDEVCNTTPLEDTTFARSVNPGSTKVKENEQLTKTITKWTPILVAAAKNDASMETIEKIVELSAIDKVQVRRKSLKLIHTVVKYGVLEMVEKIVEFFPMAIHDMDEEKKNVVLLAVEHKQPHVYQFLLKKNIYQESLFRHLDKDGNSALHLAATLGDHKPWLISGEALQMQWELKWYEFVKKSMPAGFIRPYNNNHETPDEIFTRTHSELVRRGGEWLRKTSESCSFVAALVATVAFAAATTVPGGVDQESGYPTLENERAFNVFAASSLVALCCSVMAVVTFLSLLTSRFQEQDFHKDLPMKLLIGLTLLLLSIASMLVSFCAGHFFVLKHQLHHAGFALYAVTCLSVVFYVLAQFPLYFDYLRATFVRVPQLA